MKELSIEEKAKRYDEAIEKLRTMMPNWESLSYNGKTFLQDLVHIIPELKESEDERVGGWKPSEEQMEALDFAIDCIVPAEFCFKRKALKDLLSQLKKLRKE